MSIVFTRQRYAAEKHIRSLNDAVNVRQSLDFCSNELWYRDLIFFDRVRLSLLAIVRSMIAVIGYWSALIMNHLSADGNVSLPDSAGASLNRSKIGYLRVP